MKRYPMTGWYSNSWRMMMMSCRDSAAAGTNGRERGDGVGHSTLTRGTQAREHRQRENLPRHVLGRRKVPPAPTQMGARRLEVNRDRIVNARADPDLRQILLQRVP